MASSLIVKKDETVEISEQDPHGATVEHLQPKTITALKWIAGVQVDRTPRLQDSKHFQAVASTKGLVRLRPDAQQKVNGLSATLLRTAISMFEDQEPVPKVLKITQRRRIWSRPDLKRAAKPVLIETTKAVRTWPYQVPEWLSKLLLHITNLKYKDVTVEDGGTLVISHLVDSLTADDLRIHGSGKVVQKSKSLIVDIGGELAGGLA